MAVAQGRSAALSFSPPFPPLLPLQQQQQQQQQQKQSLYEHDVVSSISLGLVLRLLPSQSGIILVR